MNTHHNSDSGTHISRREAMRRGLYGAGGVLLADRLGSDALAAKVDKAPTKVKVKAKSVIQIFLWGGMSHNDTWDPKPDSGREYMGEFMEVIPTNVDGVQLDALFPELAKQARSEEHTSELQSHSFISYAVFCLKKKKKKKSQ